MPTREMVLYGLCASVSPSLTLPAFRWHLPLVDAHDLEHFALLARGLKTQWPEAAAEAETAALKTAAKLRQIFPRQILPEPKG